MDEGDGSEVQWTKNNWEYLGTKFDEVKLKLKYKVKYKKTTNKVTQKFWQPDTDIYAEYIFKSINGKWYLVKRVG